MLQVEAEEAEGAERLPVLMHAVRVAEGALRDDSRALGYALRGVAEAIEEPDLPVWLALSERLARGVGKLDELVALLRLKVTDVVDGEVKLSLLRRVADLARVELGNQDLAVEYYTKALEVEPADSASLEALESLYQARSEWGAVARHPRAARRGSGVGWREVRAPGEAGGPVGPAPGGQGGGDPPVRVGARSRGGDRGVRGARAALRRDRALGRSALDVRAADGRR